jgi:hypothetical protein
MFQNLSIRINIIRIFVVILAALCTAPQQSLASEDVTEFKKGFKLKYAKIFPDFTEKAMLAKINGEIITDTIKTVEKIFERSEPLPASRLAIGDGRPTERTLTRRKNHSQRSNEVFTEQIAGLIELGVTLSTLQNDLFIYASSKGYKRILSSIINLGKFPRDTFETAFIYAAIEGRDECLMLLAPICLNDSALKNNEDLIAFNAKSVWQHFENDTILKAGSLFLFSAVFSQTESISYSLLVVSCSYYFYMEYFMPSYTPKYDINIIVPNNTLKSKINGLSWWNKRKAEAAFDKHSY